MDKYTIVGDLHITPKNLDKVEILFNTIEDMGYPVIILGDVLDTKEIIRGKCLNFIFNKLKDSKLSYTILVGNHDFFSTACQEHALEVLKVLPNVIVVDYPMIHLDMCFLPYMKDQEAIEAEINKSPNKVIFIHQSVQGFDYGNGYIAPEGLDFDSLTKCKRIIAGHFHKYQERGNLTYLGTPFSHTFGESGQAKYIATYQVSTNKLELLETRFPKHITTIIDCDNWDFTSILELDPNDYHRVVLKGTQELIDQFDKKAYSLPIKWIEKPSNAIVEGLNIDETLNNIVKFKDWAENVKNLDSETIKLGIQILEALDD